MIAEIAVLRQLTSDPPSRPYVVVLGGAKPSDKLAVIGNLLGRADRLIICGGMSSSRPRGWAAKPPSDARNNRDVAETSGIEAA